MAYSQSHGSLKCACCLGILDNPVQLPACLHILCLDCERKLESNAAHNICCPKCHAENARPSMLQLISGVEQSHEEIMLCDISLEHGIAKWNCFECGANLCGSCRVSHAKQHNNHNINLLAPYKTLEDRIWNKSSESGDVDTTDIIPQEEEQTDNSTDRIIQCPMCIENSCQHVQALQYLIDGPQNCVRSCQQKGHNGMELKFFCKVCWIPVCGECSQKGKHKLHECDDVSTYEMECAVKSLVILKEKLHMMIDMCKQDVSATKSVEEQLRRQICDADKELNYRKSRIMNETELIFDKAITDAELQGSDIMMDYRDKLHAFEKFFHFLQKVNEAFTSFTTDEHQPTVMQCISPSHYLKFAAELIQQIHTGYQAVKRPAERQIVLPQVGTDITTPSVLARVGTEWKHLQLAFSFKLDDDHHLIKSIVLIDSTTCLLTVKKMSGRSGFDSIVRYQYKSDKKCAELTVYDTDPGDYFITQLPSGEIVASYTSPRNDLSYHSKNAVCYCNKLPVNSSSTLRFKAIREFYLPCCSIATTKDNNILVCINADEKKGPSGFSYLTLLNLLGTELKTTVKQGPDMISPNHVTVSDSGEICVSDTDGSSIVILDENLEIKERMNYQLPTSLKDTEMYPFQPHGVCYDYYGRIIVADQLNGCVSRLLRAQGSNKFKLEPLLDESCELTGFRQPNLVAMGSDARLWVVCAEHIFVFDYCA